MKFLDRLKFALMMLHQTHIYDSDALLTMPTCQSETGEGSKSRVINIELVEPFASTKAFK